MSHSGMSMLEDGCPADPAYESDWDKAIDKVSEPDIPYQIGIQFLKDYLAIGYISQNIVLCYNRRM